MLLRGRSPLLGAPKNSRVSRNTPGFSLTSLYMLCFPYISRGFRLCLVTSHYLWAMDKKWCFANKIAAKCKLLYEFWGDLSQMWIDVMGQSTRSSAALVANIRLNLIVIAQRATLWLYSQNIKVWNVCSKTTVAAGLCIYMKQGSKHRWYHWCWLRSRVGQTEWGCCSSAVFAHSVGSTAVNGKGNEQNKWVFSDRFFF